jgi:outer membrane protein assembly factor BamD (BamD/ComL family)
MPTSNTFVERVVRELSALKALWKSSKPIFLVVLIVGLIVALPVLRQFTSSVSVSDDAGSNSPVSKPFESQNESALDSLRQPQNAEEALHMGQFALARTMFKDALLRESDYATADEIRGMVTATYYGEGLHQEGLEYVCEQYKFKTPDNRAFLFGVHAHIRAISVRSGPTEAEKTASNLRAKCHRPDFSEFWAHIPFGMMESLRMGNSRTSHNWTLKKEEAVKLSFWLDDRRRKEMRKFPIFSDFALYFLGRFDELIANYPKSSIREIALFDAAEFSRNTDKKIFYYRKFISEYPQSRYFESAISALMQLYESMGMRRKALMYASIISDRSKADSAIEDQVTRPTLRTISRFIRKGELGAALKLTRGACNDYRKSKLTCPNQFAQLEDKIQLAIGYSKLEYKSLTCSRVQLKIRSLAETGRPHKDIDWRYAARSYLVKCLDREQGNAEDYAKSLYLIASISRKVNDYKTSIEYLHRFRREIREHDLLDDVICEIGYHQMFIEGDWEKARQSFSEVISKYPSKNAYDNALWWYGIGSKNVGNFSQAVPAFAEIGALEFQSRFRQWSISERERIMHIVALEPFSGISFQSKVLGGDGLIVAAIAPRSVFAKALSKGDKLLRVCGDRVSNADELLELAEKNREMTYCDIDYLRGNLLVRLSKDQGHEWRSEVTKLSEEQLADIAWE